MFNLNRQKSYIDSVNARAEKFGPDTKLAFDVFFNLNVSNDVLAHFDSQLKSALFKKGDSPQGELIADDDRLPALRFPKIGAVKWGEKFPGYALILHVGINDDSDIKLADVELDRFAFDPKDGGACGVRFRAIVHPRRDDIGALCELIQREVEVSAKPPDPAAELNPPADDGGQQSFADAAAAAIAEHQQQRAA